MHISKPKARPQDEEVPTETTRLLATSLVAPTADQNVASAITMKGHEPDHDSNLLDDVESDSSSTSTTKASAPLPMGQIFALCYARLVEPIAFFGIFPFINTMVQRNGNLAESEVGFYSGLIESLFSVTQMVVMIFWGRLADRIGRKPVLVISLFGISATTSLFGFGRTIGQMILFRCLAGIFAGSIVTIRTMISEVSTKETQATAFSFFAVAGNMGIFLGPLIGGALTDPAQQFPKVFGSWDLFKKYPYALATLATGAVGFSAAIVTVIFTKETKASLKPVRSTTQGESTTNRGAATATTSLSPEVQGADEGTLTTLELLRRPGVAVTLGIYGYIMLLAIAYTCSTPVFWFTSPELGGFGFSPFYISLYMSISGLFQAIWLLFIYPPVHKRIQTGGVLSLCATAYPLFFCIFPFLSLLLRQGSHTARLIFWIVGPPLLAVGSGVSMAFTAVQLAINDISPNMQSLGTLNALALTSVSGLRAVTPALFSSIFALGVKHQILWGYLAWVILIVLGVGLKFILRWLPEEAAGTKKTK